MLVFGGVCDPKSLKLGHWLSDKMKKPNRCKIVELLIKLEVYGVSFSKYTFPLKLPSILGFIWLFVSLHVISRNSHVAILAFGRNFDSNNNHLCIRNFQRKQSTTPERTPRKEIPSSNLQFSRGYCWWTKSCTTKDDDYPGLSHYL